MLYRKVASSRSDEELEGVRSEMEDRFGRLPPEAVRLLDAARLRLLAEQLHVRQIDYRLGVLQVKFSDSSPLDPARLLPWLSRHEGSSITPAGLLRVPARWEPRERIGAVLEALRVLG
jgi:transcription-repair coupling factor (superfamily II helicase)